MPKHFISNKDESPKMFKNKFLDLFTRVHWSIPLILYVPILCWLLYRGVFEFHVPALTAFGLLIAGFIAWTFAEYVLHRFVFHYELPGELGRKIHFIMHGVHHDYPMDSMRLVMPPPLSIPLYFLFFYLFSSTLGMAYTMWFFPGFIIGYLGYDMMHYALHHANIKAAWFKALKEHHMVHHFTDPHHGFGVSSKAWDYVFGSTFKFKKEEKVTTK